MTGRVILVRHGRSTGNLDENFYHYRVDSVVCLAELGVKQCIYAGEELKKIHGEYLKWDTHGVMAFASEYTRAQQSGRIILDIMGLKHVNMEITPAINERFYGDDDRPSDWFTNPYATCTNGESLVQAKDRFEVWWKTVEPHLSQKDIVLFCHGEIMKGITASLLRLTDEELVRVSVPNAVPTIYERISNGIYMKSEHKFQRYDKKVEEVLR